MTLLKRTEEYRVSTEEEAKAAIDAGVNMIRMTMYPSENGEILAGSQNGLTLKETLDAVMNARAKATQLTVDVDDLSEENIRKYQEAQGELQQAMGRLMMITENYPDLKANQNFRNLQEQLEGTENRIAVARNRYISTVQDFNSYARQFPQVMTAKVIGMDTKPNFSAEQSAQTAPKVSFE